MVEQGSRSMVNHAACGLVACMHACAARRLVLPLSKPNISPSHILLRWYFAYTQYRTACIPRRLTVPVP
jgi:hypothetical protein